MFPRLCCLVFSLLLCNKCIHKHALKCVSIWGQQGPNCAWYFSCFWSCLCVRAAKVWIIKTGASLQERGGGWERESGREREGERERERERERAREREVPCASCPHAIHLPGIQRNGGPVCCCCFLRTNKLKKSRQLRVCALTPSCLWLLLSLDSLDLHLHLFTQITHHFFSAPNPVGACRLFMRERYVFLNYHSIREKLW